MLKNKNKKNFLVTRISLLAGTNFEINLINMNVDEIHLISKNGVKKKLNSRKKNLSANKLEFFFWRASSDTFKLYKKSYFFNKDKRAIDIAYCTVQYIK